MSDRLLRDEPFRPEIVSSETVFHGRVWNVRRDTFRYNDAEITRDYVDHTGAVAVLLDIRGEDPLTAVKRELAEEADLVADEWNVLADTFTSPGGSDEAIRIYLARGVHAAPEVFAREEEEADIETVWLPLDDAVDAVLARTLHNTPLMIAVLAARTAREKGWATLGAADEPWPSHPKLAGE
jgi:8-oxo-dGTP pyrophosphatase MutT (NUDIX family)